MDRGELDGRSNLGSMLNSVAENDLGHSSHEKDKKTNPKSRSKKTTKSEHV